MNSGKIRRNFIVCEDADRENASSGSSLLMIITLVVVYTNGLSDRMIISILHNTLPFNRTYSIIPIYQYYYLSIISYYYYNLKVTCQLVVFP